MNIIKVFSGNVKRYRKEKGYSQEYFAELCGMHRTYISSLECCRRSISLENIQRLHDYKDKDCCNTEADKVKDPFAGISRFADKPSLFFWCIHRLIGFFCIIYSNFLLISLQIRKIHLNVI